MVELAALLLRAVTRRPVPMEKRLLLQAGSDAIVVEVAAAVVQALQAVLAPWRSLAAAAALVNLGVQALAPPRLAP